MNKVIYNDKRDKIYSVVFLCISILFYLFFSVYDGAVICVDSPGYINMHISREPFYCIFLAVIRCIFGGDTETYLTAVAYLQGLLAALAAWCLADYLRKELKLSCWQAGVVLAMPMVTSLLCRFAAKRGSMYSNSILTEGIACSLFLIFIRFLLEYYYRQKIKSLISTCVLSFILIATRKQMYLTLMLLIVILAWVIIKEKKWKKGILTIAACVLCVLGSNVVLDSAYNFLVRGEVGTHSSDNRFMATMVFYTAERDDGMQIQDESTRDLFYRIYDICDEQGYLKHSAGEGWYNRVAHFGDHYDHIQIDTMWPMIQHYVYENYEGGEVYLEQKVDEITNQIIVGVLPNVWVDVIGCFLDNFLSGLITTVAQRRPILILYSFVAYILYVVLLIVHMKFEGMTKLSFLAISTLISIMLNVAIVSMVIFCQTRYTIYNMPLFYISLWLLVTRNIRLLATKYKYHGM